MAKEKVKDMEKALHQMLDSYQHNLSSGKTKLTPQDASAISSILQGLVFSEIHCLISDLKEKGLPDMLKKFGIDKQGHDRHIGFGGQPGFSPDTWQAKSPAYVQGFQPRTLPPVMEMRRRATSDYADAYNDYANEAYADYARRGVPGTGTHADMADRTWRKLPRADYAEMDAEMEAEMEAEMRRRRSKRTGRFIKGDMESDTLSSEHEKIIHDAFLRGVAAATMTHPANKTPWPTSNDANKRGDYGNTGATGTGSGVAGIGPGGA